MCSDFDAGYNLINTDWNPLYLVHSANAGFAAGPEALSGACKFRHNKDAGAILLARNILEAHEIHAVAEARHERYIRDRVKGHKLVKVEAPVEVMDGHGAEAAEG